MFLIAVLIRALYLLYLPLFLSLSLYLSLFVYLCPSVFLFSLSPSLSPLFQMAAADLDQEAGNDADNVDPVEVEKEKPVDETPSSAWWRDTKIWINLVGYVASKISRCYIFKPRFSDNSRRGTHRT